MAETTGISWTDSTFNPWRGCSKVSPGCAHCYAEKLAARNPSVLGTWGPNGTRVIAAESYWRQPLKWEREAVQNGCRHRVFCASLADVFEDRVDLIEPLARLLRLIHLTPHLDWQLLTKRPEAITRRLQLVKNIAPTSDQDINDGADLAAQWLLGSPMPNIWLGCTVENQEAADRRIPALLTIPATVHFLSCEPLLEPLDLHAVQTDSHWPGKSEPSKHDVLRGFTCSRRERFVLNGIIEEKGEVPFVDVNYAGRVDWVIVGGESGPRARMFHLGWARDIQSQCQAAGAAFFMKQCGSNPHDSHFREEAAGFHPIKLRDRAGADPAEWPEDLRVQDFPTPQEPRP